MPSANPSKFRFWTQAQPPRSMLIFFFNFTSVDFYAFGFEIFPSLRF